MRQIGGTGQVGADQCYAAQSDADHFRTGHGKMRQVGQIRMGASRWADHGDASQSGHAMGRY